MTDGSKWDRAALGGIFAKTTTLKVTRTMMIGMMNLTRTSPHAVQRTVGIVDIVIISAVATKPVVLKSKCSDTNILSSRPNG